MTDIFLRSYRNDASWIPFALRSIDRFVSGVRHLIIAVPDEDLEIFRELGLTRERLVASRISTDAMNPYLGQQADKLSAHLYSDAEYFLFWDSDVVAIRPFNPGDLMIDGKPRCLETPWDKLVNPDGTPATPWRPIVERALGHPVSKERMRAHPMMAHRMALIGLRDYMQKIHHVPLVDYIASQPNREFSEWNVLHSWAADHAPEFFTFWDTEKEGVPEPFVKQYHSWSGLTPEIRAEMERILA